MAPTDEFATGDVRLTWHADEGLVEMRFQGPRAHPTEQQAEACLVALNSWVAERPVRILVDCANVANTDAGWRAAFAGWMKARGYRDSIAWCNLSPLIHMMASMFARATRADARVFRGEEDARAWLRSRGGEGAP